MQAPPKKVGPHVPLSAGAACTSRRSAADDAENLTRLQRRDLVALERTPTAPLPYVPLTGAQKATWHRGVDRASLPTPVHYLSQHGLLVTQPRGEWAQIRCPSHKGGSERNPSMSISLIDGHFRCH